MAGADETPNDRAGSYRPNKMLPQNIESPSLLIGTLSLPYYTLVTFFRRIARPRLLSGEDLVVMR